MKGIAYAMSKLPIFKSSNAIAEVGTRHGNELGFENLIEAQAALEMSDAVHKRSFDIKDVRLNSLLEMGADAKDPMVDEFRNMDDQRWAMVDKLEKKYGPAFDEEVKVATSEVKDDEVDIHLVEQLQEPVRKSK